MPMPTRRAKSPRCDYTDKCHGWVNAAPSIGSVGERMLLRIADGPLCRLAKLESLTRGRQRRIGTENLFPINNRPSQLRRSGVQADRNRAGSGIWRRKNVVVHAIGCSRHLTAER